jgi:amino acid transporter
MAHPEDRASGARRARINVFRMAADDTEALTALPRGMLSTLELMSAGLAQIAPAIATFFVLGGIVAVSGLATPLVVLIAGIGFALHVNSNAEFNRVIPSSGFYVTYLSRVFGQRAGAASAAIYTFAYVTIGASLFFQIGVWTNTSVRALFGFSLPWWIPAVVIEAGVATLMVLGVRLSIRVAVALFGFEIAVMIAGAIAMIAAHPGAATGESFNPANLAGGVSGLGLGFPLAIFLFLGASTPAPMAEETSSPRRGVPLAIFGATFVAIAIYVFMSWAENVGFGNNTHALVQASYPFLTAAGNAAGPLKDVMYVAGFTSAVAVLLAAGNPTSRVWFNMAREGVLPRWFGQVHPRFRTPARVIVLFVLIEMAITLAVGFSIGADNGFGDLASAGTIGAVILFIAVNFALTAYFARTRRDMFSIPRHVIAPSLGTIAFAYPLYETVKPDQPSPFNWFGLMWLILLAAAIGYGILIGHRVRLGHHLADGDEAPGTAGSGAGTADGTVLGGGSV